uniref:Cytoplasmic protein n=1 Tax=Kwoniella dejecticola CBS 10117 TaxID=1296121 RepID=A0A1A6AEZ6_9TREE|nr:cytoplasmic protein [Kwoniella dejecticola CBS 10117]OBR88647.1 cytoplasmic protein [Kwoniella dejecticola CBS 10117]
MSVPEWNPQHEENHQLLSTERNPITDATLTIRIIKSFEFRTQKSMVVKHLNLEELTVGALMELVRNGEFLHREKSVSGKQGKRMGFEVEWDELREISLEMFGSFTGREQRDADDTNGLKEIKTQSGYKPYRTLVLDTMKLYTLAHGSKTTNLIINLDHDEWILDPSSILKDIGAQNETEISFFNRESYDKFKLNPEVKWD